MRSTRARTIWRGTTSRSFPLLTLPSAGSAARSVTTGCSLRRCVSLRPTERKYLVRVSAYMDPWGATEPMNWWSIVNRCRAIENMSYVVAANQGASLRHYPPYSWPGGSQVVDFDGRMLAEASPGPGERIVVAPIDISALRHERETRRGHHMLSHLRTEAYPVYSAHQTLQPPRAQGTDYRTSETLSSLSWPKGSSPVLQPRLCNLRQPDPQLIPGDI